MSKTYTSQPSQKINGATKVFLIGLFIMMDYDWKQMSPPPPIPVTKCYCNQERKQNDCGIRDKTMADKLIYLPNDDTLN